MKAPIYTLIILLFCGFSLTSSAQNVALNFDGSDDFIQTTHPGISGQNARTVEAMIRTTANCDPNKGGKQKVIVDWGAASSGARFTLNILSGNALRLEFSGAGINGKTAINDGKWHHVAATYAQIGKQNDIKLYVDGVLDASGSITATNISTGTSVNIRIGQRIDGTNNFDGDIDEVRIFNFVRSASAIKADMEKEYCNYPKGLVGYFKLNEGDADSSNKSNKTAKDYSSSKKNGTLSNFTLSGSGSNWITGDTLTGGDTKSNKDVFGCYSYTTSKGKVYTSPGTYTTTLTNTAGCDSIITLKVELGRIYKFTRHTVCDSFVTPLGNVYYQTGLYRDTLKGVTPKGCDSVLLMEVLVNQKLETQEDLVVCDSTRVDGKWYFTDVQLTQNGTAVTGCDSTHTIDIDVNESSSFTMVETHCDRFKSSLGNTYTKTGIYKEKLSKANQHKCDSLIIIDLTIHDISNVTVPVQDCDSFIAPSGKHYLTNGVHTERYTSQFGCDSIIAYDLVLSDTKVTSDKVEACDSIMVNNIWRTSSEVIEFTDVTGQGCDSFVTIDLEVTTINNNVMVSGSTLTADQVADGYQWVDCKTDRSINGETSISYTPQSSGTYAVDITLSNCTKRSDCIDAIGLSVPGFDNNHQATVIPNPSTGNFIIETTGEAINTIRITDINGRVMYKTTNLNQSRFEVTSHLAPGVYHVTIDMENKTAVKRVVVQ
ncbi:MAG: hypothetical protein ACI9JN_000021 [Bacteroidia bacterium]|jgi:hypothetical protein